MKITDGGNKSEGFYFEIVDKSGTTFEYYATKYLVRKAFVAAIKAAAGPAAGSPDEAPSAEEKGTELRSAQASVGAPGIESTTIDRKERAKLLSRSLSNASAASDSTDALKVGFLMKKGGGKSMLGRRNWKKRYFRLTDSYLLYYKSDKSKKPAGCMPVDSAVRVSAPKNEKYYTYFVVSRSGEVLELRAHDLDGMAEWKVAIENAAHAGEVPS